MSARPHRGISASCLLGCRLHTIAGWVPDGAVRLCHARPLQSFLAVCLVAACFSPSRLLSPAQRHLHIVRLFATTVPESFFSARTAFTHFSVSPQSCTVWITVTVARAPDSLSTTPIHTHNTSTRDSWASP